MVENNTSQQTNIVLENEGIWDQLCPESEGRMYEAIQSNSLLSIQTPNGSLLYLKDIGKVTALCIRNGLGDNFEEGWFYSPYRESLDPQKASSMEYLRQYYGLIGNGNKTLHREIKGFTGNWVKMRSIDPDFDLTSFAELAENNLQGCPTFSQSEVRKRYQRLRNTGNQNYTATNHSDQYLSNQICIDEYCGIKDAGLITWPDYPDCNIDFGANMAVKLNLKIAKNDLFQDENLN